MNNDLHTSSSELRSSAENTAPGLDGGTKPHSGSMKIREIDFDRWLAALWRNRSRRRESLPGEQGREEQEPDRFLRDE
jgi:hypothetical protein